MDAGDDLVGDGSAPLGQLLGAEPLVPLAAQQDSELPEQDQRKKGQGFAEGGEHQDWRWGQGVCVQGIGTSAWFMV